MFRLLLIAAVIVAAFIWLGSSIRARIEETRAAREREAQRMHRLYRLP